ncbi:MAG: hypothetical protein ACE5F9_07135 [Phycisphaerae bacterium]
MSETIPDTGRVFDRWTAWTLMGVAAFMLWGATHYTVFDDEAFSCRRYVLPLAEMVSALWHGVEPDPPLYYVLQNGWVRLTGVGPLGLRSLSMLLFLAGLVFIRLAGTAWFDAPTGRVVMLLAALHPAHLFFGFAARWYAMMFLAVAVLLYATGRIVHLEHGRNTAGRSRRPPGPPQRMSWPRMGGWAVVAAAVCYTNYFGPVVVGLVWLAGVWCTRGVARAWRRWLVALATTVALFAPWGPPFAWQLTHFPGADRSVASYMATAARTGLALLTGDLASPGAWWAWGPMILFAMAVIILCIRQAHTVGPMATVVIGCLAAGAFSLSMKDKYIMTLSGPACILAAAVLVAGWRAGRRRTEGRIARVAVTALAIGWAGCLFNLAAQRNWSSLRWLDPFESIARNVRRSLAEDSAIVVAASHPSVRYYLACLRVLEILGPDADRSWRIDPAAWQRADAPRPGPVPIRDSGVCAPRDILHAAPDQTSEAAVTSVAQWITIETTGYSDDADGATFRAILRRDFKMTRERKWLRDPDASLKDRLDPAFRHPSWRIVVRHWNRRPLPRP